MSRGLWWCAVVVGVLAAAPLPALSASGAQTTKEESTARQNDPEIVVTAAQPQKRSGWKRAETDHIVVFSDGAEPELVRVINTLERLHALMTRLYGAAGQQEGAPKLQITLFASRDDLKKLGLRNMRSQEGPFARSFTDQRYYDPRADGEILAIARSDQLIDLNTNLARDRFCEDLAAQGTDCIGKREPYLLPVLRPWEAVLYSAFAQHFILSNVPAPYPRWYLDGIGALFSTIEVRKDGSFDYAKPPDLYSQVFRSYGDVNARDVLAGNYLDAPSRRMTWTPYHAWLITHFFVFSTPKPALCAQFAQYMAAIGRGASLAEAASAFGDLGRLNREIRGYASRAKAFATADPPEALQGSPSVTVLSPAQAAVLKAKIRLGELLSPDASGEAEEQSVSGDTQTQWIDEVHNKVSGLPFDADAMLVVVEAECRSARSSECLADAERSLAQSPQNARALAWKGVALTDQALASPSNVRAGTLALARETIEHAMRIDPRDPVAAIAYFQSFAKAGMPVPESGMAGLAKVAASVPAAPTPRLLLGKELVRQGKVDLARRLLKSVLYGAYDSPEKRAAQALFSPVAMSGASVRTLLRADRPTASNAE
jgi:hypothetical protein